MKEDKENDGEKKYNDDEWNEIYNKRFKEYEEIKKKKMEIQREKEKIEKMLQEEEQILMFNNNTKKLPEYKIKENTQRLYDDAKKREILKNKRKKQNKNNNIFSSI